jgi:hypothetical protein
MHRIKLPNGGRILTDDDAAMSLLRKRHRKWMHRLLDDGMLIRVTVALLLGLVVLSGVWWVLD